MQRATASPVEPAPAQWRLPQQRREHVINETLECMEHHGHEWLGRLLDQIEELEENGNSQLADSLRWCFDMPRVRR